MSGRCFRHYVVNVDFNAIKIDYKFFWPQCEKVVEFLFEKPLKISFFARDLYLGKNSKSDLLGWLNECRGAAFVIML